MLRVTTKHSDRRALKGWMNPPPYITNPELALKTTQRKLFAEWPGAVDGVGRLTPAEETLLFKQLHYCGYYLSKLYKTANRAPTVTTRKVYATWVQRYHKIRTRLTEGNLGLVYDLMGRSRFENLDREDMTSEGLMALLRAVDTFDPWRGFRFSTYACNAILRSFSRAAMQDSKRRSKVAGPWDPEFEISDAPEVRRADQRALFTERLERVLRLDNADLTEVEKMVLVRRFPFEEDRTRQTLEDIGKQMRVSKERVRQIQLSAISKLRRVLAEDSILK
jgi:RNA polymerase primary sigma factor